MNTKSNILSNIRLAYAWARFLMLLALGACANDVAGDPCAFDTQAEYLYRALPNGREQGPATLRQIIGAEPNTPAECNGESYTVHTPDADLTFRITDTSGDALIVKLSGNDAAAMLELVEQ